MCTRRAPLTRFNSAPPIPGDASYDQTWLDIIAVISSSAGEPDELDPRRRTEHVTLVLDQLGALREVLVVSENTCDPAAVRFSDWRRIC